MTATSGTHNSADNHSVIAFAAAGAVVLLSVAIAERVSMGAAWGLVLLIFLGALVSHPALIQTITNLASGE